jgi:hypothetical protein
MPILSPLPRPQRRRIHKIIHSTCDNGHTRRLIAALLLREGCSLDHGSLAQLVSK